MVLPKTFTESIGKGSDAIEVVATLLRTFPKATSAVIAELQVPPTAQNRFLIKNTQLDALVSSALTLRGDYGIPFWMAIMFEAEKKGVQLPRELLQAASFHQPMTAAKTEKIPVEVISAEYLRARSATAGAGRILTFSSKVTSSDGSSVHIPMLDFRISSSARSLSTAIAVLRELRMEGWLLDSGQSYHFYGISKLSEAGFTDFLARALFFTPIVDYRWIAHQLIEGACALRFSSGSNLQRVPSVVAEVSL